MHWALQHHDPDNWLKSANHPLIHDNDHAFKQALDAYKYADRFPEHPETHYRTQGEVFLKPLESILQSSPYIQGKTLSYVDIAIVPFVRQFSLVDKHWFAYAPYPHLRIWLERILSSQLFINIMHKYPVWQTGDKPIIFPSR